MLHPQALAVLGHLARRSAGAVVEIGAFIGGATVVMAKAMEESGNTAPLITIEAGGSRAHPHLFSADIISDLRKALTGEGLLGRVKIVEGWSNDPATVAQVKDALGYHRIGLLVIDADGEVGRDMELYGPAVAANALIVCDDYSAAGDNVKEVPVRAWVDGACQSGLVQDLGLFPHGTWVGRYRGTVTSPLVKGPVPHVPVPLRLRWMLRSMRVYSAIRTLRQHMLRLRQSADTA